MDKNKPLEENDFVKQNPILFKKFKIKNKLAEGAFGDVYIGSTLDTNDPVAIKVELKKIAKPLLESEAYFLLTLKGIGIPEVLSFGRRKDYNILVEPLLGKSLFDIFNERRRNHMAICDICLIAKQVLDRIQWVHSKGFVHRDIKPDNFLIGRKDPNVIYLIDFGLSKKYKSDKTGKHIKFGFTGKLTGTVRFASANALRGGEQSRRDDLESIAYMIIFFMREKLPWQGVTGTKKMERYLKIYKMKKNVTPEDLCKSLPTQMISFVKYVKQLEFEQEPDYNYLRSLIQSILKERNRNFDSFVFSWIKISDIKKLKDPINPATRKESPQGRLLRKIETKLKNERNNSSDNDSGQRSYQTADALTQDKEINYASKDEAEVEVNKFKTKKEKSKEGLNTLVANLNQSLDENFNFEDNEKKEKNQLKKKNYTVNDTLDYKTEMKIQNNENSASNKHKGTARDKSEEIKLTNCNERKISLMVIDENEEKNKNENMENNNEKKEENKNNDIKKEKEKNEKKIIEIENNNNINNDNKKIKNKDEIQKFNQKQNIIPIKKGKMNTESININNNINLIKKNIDSESPEKINNININRNNIIPIQKESNNSDNQIKIKKENQIKNNTQNIITMPNKNIQKNSNRNLDISNKGIKGKKFNKNNIIIKKGIDLNIDKANIQIKNQQKNQKVNIKTKKIKVDKRPNKLMIESEEGPMDNKRNNYIKMNERMAFNTEVSNNEVGFNSSKNVDEFINVIKLKNKNNIHERRHTPNNIYNMKNIRDNNIQKYKNNISAFNQKNLDLDLLPQNTDEMLDNNTNKFISDKIIFNNNERKKISNLSHSTNLLQENDNMYNKLINNINNKSNITFNMKRKKHNKSNERLDNHNDNNDIPINNFMKPENNNSNNNINNDENLKNYEFNANRKIRIVNRNKNQNKNINPKNNLNIQNYKNIHIYNTFSDNPGYKNPSNTTYEPQNININNHINNNIIINNNISNKYSQPKNSTFRSNSNNPYPNQNIIAQNLVLSKRPSHNVNSNKIMRSFKVYMNTNPNINSIQYMKRPSHNIKNNNINNNINTNINNNNNNNNIHYNPVNQIIVNKRPSYNTNFNVKNFLNNTETKKTQIGSTKIKKLPNKNNISGHIQVKGKYTEIIEDNRVNNNIEFINDYGQEQYNPNLNKTYNNNVMVNKLGLESNFNNNNNIFIYKDNNLNNFSKMSNVNYPLNQNLGNTNKIKIEKIPNYKNNYQSKIGNYQNVNTQFDNNAQFYGFSNY